MSQSWQENRKKEELSVILAAADENERKAKIYHKYRVQKIDRPERNSAKDGLKKVKDN